MFIGRTNHDRPLLIQTTKRGVEVAFGSFLHSLPVLGNPLSFGSCLPASRVLTPNLGEFDGLERGILLNGAQRIGGFDCGMLASVARENYPAFIGFRQAQELVHLLAADLTGLIDKDHTSSGEVPVRQNRADGLGTMKTIPCHVHDLLPLRSDDRDRSPGLLQRAEYFPQRIALAGAGSTTKQGDKVA